MVPRMKLGCWGVVEAHSFEASIAPGVKFHDIVIVFLGGTGTIRNGINDTGGSAGSGNNVSDLVSSFSLCVVKESLIERDVF